VETVLRELQGLGGILSGCVFKEGEIIATTFENPDDASLVAAGKMFAQVSMGMESIGRGLNEILFEYEDKYLIGYPVDSEFFICLLSDKQTNFSLVRMTVQAAARKIKKLAENPVAARPAPVAEPAPAAAPAPKAAAAPKATPAAAKTAPVAEAPAADERDLEPLLQAIQRLLTENIGPAAKIVFNHALKRWRGAPGASIANIPTLAEMLAEDLSTEGERTDFLRQVDGLIAG
jgi:predicted regulator of Ras-like GTPase activity (Roadblock/LC7/MglB family)